MSESASRTTSAIESAVTASRESQGAVRVREETVHGIYSISIRVRDALGVERDPFEVAKLLEEEGLKIRADVVRGLVGEVVRLRDDLRARVLVDPRLVQAVRDADARWTDPAGIAMHEGARRDTRIALANAILAQTQEEG